MRHSFAYILIHAFHEYHLIGSDFSFGTGYYNTVIRLFGGTMEGETLHEFRSFCFTYCFSTQMKTVLFRTQHHFSWVKYLHIWFSFGILECLWNIPELDIWNKVHSFWRKWIFAIDCFWLVWSFSEWGHIDGCSLHSCCFQFIFNFPFDFLFQFSRLFCRLFQFSARFFYVFRHSDSNPIKITFIQ